MVECGASPACERYFFGFLGIERCANASCLSASVIQPYLFYDEKISTEEPQNQGSK